MRFVLLLLLLLPLAFAGAAQALSWREWTDLPVGASVTTAAVIGPEAAPAHDGASARRLDGTPAPLDSTIGFLNRIDDNSVSLASILSSLQGIDLSGVSNAVTVATSSADGANPAKDSIDGAVERLGDALDSVVKHLDGIVAGLSYSLVIGDLKVLTTDVNNLWVQLNRVFPAKMSEVASQCTTIMGSSERTLAKLGATQFLSAADKDAKIARAVTNAMLATVVMRQICTGGAMGIHAHAAQETGQVAVYLRRAAQALGDDVLKSKAQGLIDRTSSGAASTASNEQLLNPLQQFLGDGATLFDGLTAALNSDAFRRALGSDRNTATSYGALDVMIAVADRQEVKKLNVLNNTVDETYKIRMGEYVKIDASVDFWHGQKMEQIGVMQNVFGGQHEERMGGLNAVNSKVQAVTAQAAQGFGSIQLAVMGMQAELKSQIGLVAGKVQDDAAETRAYLSGEIEAAGQRTVEQIAQIDAQVVQGGRAIADALARTTAVANAEFDATLGTLASASSSMSNAITGASQQLQTAITSGFDTTRKIVAGRIVDAATGLSAGLALVDRKIQFVNGRIEVLRDQLASVENKMQAVNDLLRALDVSVSAVLSQLRDAIAGITSVLFENDWAEMTRSFDNLRRAYAAVVANPQSNAFAALFKTACTQEQAMDRFLSFVHVLDVPDAQLERQLLKFDHDAAKYEAFGKTVIASLHQLSLLSTTCSALSFNLTTADLERKSREHATLITRVARAFMRQFDDVVPIYMLRGFVAQELETASTEPWGDAPTQQLKAQRLRDKLQRAVGDFAQLTVLYAGDDSLNVTHVDAQYTTAAADVAAFKRFGVMVSRNAKLAVFWSATPVLAAVDHAALDRERLLSMGVFRGDVSAPRGGCSVAQNASFYPRCDEQCRCAHFENFASATDPYAGRAITVLNATDAASDFAVRATQAPLVDYVLDELLVDIAGLGASAYGKIEADVVLPRAASSRHALAPLWEDYTDHGRLHAAPSDVKGTRLTANAVTLTLQYQRPNGGDAVPLRKVLPLFCDAQRHAHTLAEPAATVTYRCREEPHTTLRDGTDAVVASGALRSRVDQAVCVVVSATERQCKVAGEVRSLPNTVERLEVGRYVSDLTVYGGADFAGAFAICKGCSSRELAQQLGVRARSFALATPTALALSFLPGACTKRTESVMVCDAAAA